MSPEAWVEAQWARCEPILQRAIARSDDTFDAAFVWREIQEGRAQLWPSENSGVVTSVRTAPTGHKFLEMWLAAGDLDELKRLKPHIEDFGRSQNCRRSVIVGREGWRRAFPDYRLGSVLLTKDL